MRTINKSRNFLAYAILATLAFTCVFLVSNPAPAVADSPGEGTNPPDTIPIGGGEDTTGHGSSISSDTNSPSTLDMILIILESAVF